GRAPPTNPGVYIAVIDPRARTFVNHFGLTACTPHGLALGPHPFAIVGCNDPTHSFIINILTGAVIEIPQVSGSDQVTYNPGDNRYYLGTSPNTRTLAAVVAPPLNP